MKQASFILVAVLAAQGEGSRHSTARSVARNLNHMKTNAVAKFRSLTADEEFLLRVQQDCPNELAEFTDQQNLDALEELVDCIKDIFNDLLLDCLADVEALAPVAECLIDVGLDDVFLKDRFDEDDAEDDFDDFDFEDLFKIDNIFKYGDLDDKYDELDDIEINELDQEACDGFLGESEFPHVFACLLLLDIDDLDDFEDFIEDELEDSEVCQDLADFVDEDDAAEFFEEVFFDKLEKLDDDEEGLCNPDVGPGKLDKLQEIADACAEFDDGELLDNIQEFSEASRTTSLTLAGTFLAYLIFALI